MIFRRIRKFIILGIIISFFFSIPVMAKEEDTITISFAGDCTLGTYKGQGAGGRFDEVYNELGYTHFFDNVKDIFKNDDLTIVNLEGPLTDAMATAVKKFPIRGEKEYVKILKYGNVDMVALDNNHTFDCETIGFNETIEVLEQNNIKYSYAPYIAYSEIKDKKIALISYIGFSSAEGAKKTIQEFITMARKEKADIILIMYHWGIERENYSNKDQEELAHFSIDNGADMVIGCHPHVIQGIEKYKGKTIIYSLGNFCFGANKNPKDKDTFIFQQEFKINKNGKIEYGNYNIIPCSISSVSNKNDYKPTPLEGENKKMVLDRLRKYSSKYKESIFID